MSCAQLSITNKGTPVVQPSTVSFPGAYNSTSDIWTREVETYVFLIGGVGIETNVYAVTTYTPPGQFYKFYFK